MYMNDGTEKQCLKPYIHIRYFLRLIRWHNNCCKKHIVMIYHFNQIQVHRYYSRGMIADFLPFRRKCFRICIDILICFMLSECVCVCGTNIEAYISPKRKAMRIILIYGFVTRNPIWSGIHLSIAQSISSPFSVSYLGAFVLHFASFALLAWTISSIFRFISLHLYCDLFTQKWRIRIFIYKIQPADWYGIWLHRIRVWNNMKFVFGNQIATQIDLHTHFVRIEIYAILYCLYWFCILCYWGETHVQASAAISSSNLTVKNHLYQS